MLKTMSLRVPQHFQKEWDYACGPVSIRMVADYYNKKINRDMSVDEWLNVLRITMNFNIRRKSGTNKNKIRPALNAIGIRAYKIKGTTYESKYKYILTAINKGHPIIVYCRIKPYKKFKPYKHFAVIVGANGKSLFILDPFPLGNTNKEIKKIDKSIFGKITPNIGEIVWGPLKWGVEVVGK